MRVISHCFQDQCDGACGCACKCGECEFYRECMALKLDGHDLEFTTEEAAASVALTIRRMLIKESIRYGITVKDVCRTFVEVVDNIDKYGPLPHQIDLADNLETIRNGIIDL